MTSKARGLGLQRRFFKEAEKQLEDTIYEYFLGTVHPDNIYSRTNFVKAVTGKQDKCQNMVVCNVYHGKGEMTMSDQYDVIMIGEDLLLYFVLMN